MTGSIRRELTEEDLLSKGFSEFKDGELMALYNKDLNRFAVFIRNGNGYVPFTEGHESNFLSPQELMRYF